MKAFLVALFVMIGISSAIAAPRPGYLERVQLDGSTVTRICADAGTPMANGGTWAKDSRHHYSKDQPWDDSERYVWIEQKSTYPSKIILDATTWKPIAGNTGTANNISRLAECTEVRWRPGYPGQMVGWNKNRKEIIIFDPIRNVELWRKNIVIGDPGFGWISEGTISDDGRYTVMGTHWPSPQTTGRQDTLVMIDLSARTIGPYVPHSMPYKTGRGGEVGNINISASGAYVMVKYASTPEYARIYHRGYGLFPDMFGINTLQLRPQIMHKDGLRMKETQGDQYGWIACMSHADMNMDTRLRDVVVGGIRDAAYSNTCSEFEKANQGRVIMIDLATGLHTHISAGRQWTGQDEAADQHTSGRAYKMRGWHLVTYEDSPGMFSDELVGYRLDGTRTMRRWCRTRTDDSNYRGEAHGVPNPSFTKVMFASNWQLDCGPCGPSKDDVKAYVVE